MGMKTKISNVTTSGTCTHRLWDMIVFSKTKALLGGRVRILVSGGAPLDAEVECRMSALFCCPMVEGFGMTETMGGSFITRPDDPVKGHVGGVVPNQEFRLESVPDMNYKVTQNPPCGELCVRGPAVTPGYFQNTAATAEALDSEKWLHTGDIACILPNGSVKIIDRKKNIFKLSQGEYVAPERVEAACQQAIIVAQAFVYGHSSKTSVVAIVVPDEDASRRWLAAHDEKNVPDESAAKVLQEVCRRDDFFQHVKEQMDDG
eukprot:Polyplicarium_translucidae@DN3228_c0_g2_i1.p1